MSNEEAKVKSTEHRKADLKAKALTRKQALRDNLLRRKETIKGRTEQVE